MATLLVSTTTDFSSRFLFRIDTVDFTAAATATFSGSQFNSLQVSPALHVDGSAGVNRIVVNSTSAGFNGAGWTFTNWETGDRVFVNGSQFSETLAGTSRNDVIRGDGGGDAIFGGGGDDTVEGGSGADSLTGGAGEDWLSYAGSSLGVNVNLATGLALGGDAMGDKFTGFENLKGSSGNDTLTGDAGSNRLDGGLGADVLTGGTGADRFVYTSVNDSTALARDRIADFSTTQGDRIDLSAIDAIKGGTDNAFHFVGTESFGGAGDLRVYRSGIYTIIAADTDGHGAANLEIALTGISGTLAAGDFVL